MKSQKSFLNQDQAGTLYVVPTPIGNLEDLTIRALNLLKTVDLIGAEDTRNTKKLLAHYEIHCPLTSYHEHSDDSKLNYLLSELQAGKQIAIVSDAGMPGISDPGTSLIQQAIQAGINVVVLPGANAALCALVGSGLPTDQFYFYGFLPRKNKDRRQAWQDLNCQTGTIILYESPYRVRSTLKELKDHLGNRSIAIARELTKKFEEYVRGTVDDVLQWAETGTIKGEFCIVIEGNQSIPQLEEDWWKDLTIIEHVDHYMESEQLMSKEAIKKVAQERRLQKRAVYQIYHKIED
ncbi:16S rRNA (cytidine(1402)-2'-O)-methyltransferase [Amphibacillus indicireducens]|uniref:Ribosomal RNA small subunit methyltransferase I n=1 Tax=Amphibacillus indicireducens TaxID=1076330 RepID=A0ABP7VY83_9BACI